MMITIVGSEEPNSLTRVRSPASCDVETVFVVRPIRY
jgi:hypothetical protein